MVFFCVIYAVVILCENNMLIFTVYYSVFESEEDTIEYFYGNSYQLYIFSIRLNLVGSSY